MLTRTFGHRWYGNHGGPYYPAFWDFGPKGVHIYSVEGDLLKSIPNTEICPASFFIMLSRDACGSKKTVAREISFGKDKGGVTDAKGSV